MSKLIPKYRSNGRSLGFGVALFIIHRHRLGRGHAEPSRCGIDALRPARRRRLFILATTRESNTRPVHPPPCTHPRLTRADPRFG